MGAAVANGEFSKEEYDEAREKAEESPMCKLEDNYPIIKPYSGPPISTPTPYPPFTIRDTLEAGCEVADAVDPLSPSPEFSGMNLGWGEAIDQATSYPGFIGAGARVAKVLKNVVSTPYNFTCQQFKGEGVYHDMFPIDEHISEIRSTWSEKTTSQKIIFGVVATIAVLISIPVIILLFGL